jgi:flagellar biosynthesis protein FlhF
MTYPKVFQCLFEDLLAKDVDEKLAREVIDQALHQVKQPLWDDQRTVKDAVLGIITEYIYRFKRCPVGEKGRIALIGPTGVGKTTTIAKLASIFSVIDEKWVALITLDTFRVGAVEQLKTYADIISIPIEVAHTPQELRASLAKHDDKEIVLIDTAGRSPYNKLEIAKTKGFLDACKSIFFSLQILF